MWKVDRTFLFLRSELGTDAEAQLTENVEGRIALFFLFFCGLNLEEVLAYRKCEKWIALFFFCGLNLEQMRGPAYRKCEKWIALFFLFLRSEPGTDAEPSLQKM